MNKLFLVSVCLLFQSCFFLGGSPVSRLKKAKAAGPLDAIIVPGLPLYHGRWDTLLKARILWSEFLYRRGYAKNILYSGNAVYTPWVESTSMALFAEQLGVKKENILTDTLAEHSTENLYYGYMLARQHGFKTIGIATDPFQCAMLHRFAKKNITQQIYFIPVIYDSIRPKTNVELVIDTLSTYKKNFIPISQRQNFRSRMNGTRGKNIKN